MTDRNDAPKAAAHRFYNTNVMPARKAKYERAMRKLAIATLRANRLPKPALSTADSGRWSDQMLQAIAKAFDEGAGE